jgi:hypothetical protein
MERHIPRGCAEDREKDGKGLLTDGTGRSVTGGMFQDQGHRILHGDNFIAQPGGLGITRFLEEPVDFQKPVPGSDVFVADMLPAFSQILEKANL